MTSPDEPTLLAKIVEAVLNAVPVFILGVIAWVGRLVVRAGKTFFSRLEGYEKRFAAIEKRLGLPSDED